MDGDETAQQMTNLDPAKVTWTLELTDAGMAAKVWYPMGGGGRGRHGTVAQFGELPESLASTAWDTRAETAWLYWAVEAWLKDSGASVPPDWGMFRVSVSPLSVPNIWVPPLTDNVT